MIALTSKNCHQHHTDRQGPSGSRTCKPEIKKDSQEVTEDLEYFPQDSIKIKIYEMTTYSDQTGRFPHQSLRGNEYIMIMYDFDSNKILHAPMKNRQAQKIDNAWE